MLHTQSITQIIMSYSSFFPLGILNLVNGFSNFPVLYAIASSLKQNDKITALILLFVGLASFVSHLAENHKHNLPGVLGLSPHYSYLLNRLDVIGAIITLMRSMIIYYHRYGLSLRYFDRKPVFGGLLLFSGICNIISERVPMITNNPILFTLVHSMWHLLIFTLLDFFINDI